MTSNQYDVSSNPTKSLHYLVEHNHQTMCVCKLNPSSGQACTLNFGKNHFETSYSRSFQKVMPLPQINTNPEYRYEQRHYSPDVLKTHYQQSYQLEQKIHNNSQIRMNQPELMSNSRLSQLGKTILSPSVPFVGVTSYNQHYQPYQKMNRNDHIQNPQLDNSNVHQRSKLQYRESDIKFQGLFSYKSDFTPPPKVNKQNPVSYYRKPDAPFYGTSSYKEQYQPIQISPKIQNIKYNISPQYHRVRFQGKSAYKQHFLPYKINQHKFVSEIQYFLINDNLNNIQTKKGKSSGLSQYQNY